jgi:hypothetical protein
MHLLVTPGPPQLDQLLYCNILLSFVGLWCWVNTIDRDRRSTLSGTLIMTTQRRRYIQAHLSLVLLSALPLLAIWQFGIEQTLGTAWYYGWSGRSPITGQLALIGLTAGLLSPLLWAAALLRIWRRPSVLAMRIGDGLYHLTKDVRRGRPRAATASFQRRGRQLYILTTYIEDVPEPPTLSVGGYEIVSGVPRPRR